MTRYTQSCSTAKALTLYQDHELKRNAATNLQYIRREAIELNPLPADIYEDFWRKQFAKYYR